MNPFKFGGRVVRALFGIAVIAVLVGKAAPAYATSYVAPVTELDHFFVYSWELNKFTTDKGGPINLATATSSNVSVSLVFNDIENYDSSANKLFVHMFDSSTNPSPTTMDGNIRSARDEASASSVTNIQDNMRPVNGQYSSSTSEYINGTSWPTTSGGNVGSLFGTTSYAYNAGNTFLFSKSFTATPQDYTYTFSTAQVVNFLDYISAARGGDIAIGLDSDCHYYFDDITLIVTQAGGGSSGQSAVPEPATLTLLGVGLLVGARQHRRRRQTRDASVTP